MITAYLWVTMLLAFVMFLSMGVGLAAALAEDKRSAGTIFAGVMLMIIWLGVYVSGVVLLIVGV